MRRFGDQSRYEHKFRLEMKDIPEIRKYIEPFTKLDPHLKELGGKKYTVRSIYFDTPELDYYFEKIEGLKIRKKLRVRTYNDSSEFAFLEIKRKFVNCIAKERSRLPFITIERLISTSEDTAFEFEQDDHNAKLVSGKFLYNLLKKGLVPTILVVYEREAYLGRTDERERLTIDTSVRAVAKPDPGDILNDENLTMITEDWCILELKFDDIMPKWMKDVTTRFKLKKESISKYCLGVEACADRLSNGVNE